jgi:hypothetical protein
VFQYKFQCFRATGYNDAFVLRYRTPGLKAKSQKLPFRYNQFMHHPARHPVFAIAIACAAAAAAAPAA